jgi:hypothetical protein
MTKGIVAYLSGDSQSILLSVFLKSLRKYWSGNVHIILNDVSDFVIDMIPNDVDYSFDDSEGFNLDNKIEDIWLRKAAFHKDIYPFDINLYYDIDRIFNAPIDEGIFDLAKEKGLVCSCDHMVWNEEEFHINYVKNRLGIDINKFLVADGGCVCAVKGHPVIDEWISLSLKCRKYPALKGVAEQTALSIILSRDGGFIGNKWNSREDGTDSKHYNSGRWKQKEYQNHYYDEVIGIVKNYKKIIVSGPQRSGTRIATKCIAKDLGHYMVDETDYGIDSFEGFSRRLLSDSPMVIQAPAMSSMLNYIDTKDTIIIWMLRKVFHIKKSEERVGWDSSKEMAKYFEHNSDICSSKYLNWEVYQRGLLKIPCIDLQYTSLENHNLWVENRMDFSLMQTEVLV